MENASLSRERQERIWSTLNVCVAFLSRIIRRKSFFASTTGKVAKMAVVGRLAHGHSLYSFAVKRTVIFPGLLQSQYHCSEFLHSAHSRVDSIDDQMIELVRYHQTSRENRHCPRFGSDQIEDRLRKK